MSQEMSVKQDLKCIFNMPKQLSSQFNGDQEEFHSLPPYSPVDICPVDEYEACPTNWMHGSDVASSYFVGVKENHGMWLDFNECFYHTHDVAIVISVQGINPITGQKMVAKKALKLEQYHKKCPIHKINFKQDRYCDKCGFKWPGQNYLATTGTPEMMLWLDGFRTPEGTVRQYIFTEDKMRGVASQLIGEERVFAIGIAYYLSKNKKLYVSQRPEKREYQDNYGSFLNNINKIEHSCLSTFDVSSDDQIYLDNSKMDLSYDSVAAFGGSLDNTNIGSNINASVGKASNKNFGVAETQKTGSPMASSILRGQMTGSIKPITPVKKLEIGAGALIQQRVYDDPKILTYWEEKPAGMIYINYCDEKTKKKILDAGRRADKKDGFMKDIKIGG